MTKVGILTFHNNENRGAILQAYALCKAINENFPWEAEVIEYRTKSKEHSRRNGAYLSKNPFEIPNKVKNGYRDRHIVEKFFQTELNTSDDSIVTDNHEKAVDWLERQDYDILITGSDEIWKVPNGSGSGVSSYLLPSRPFPNLYSLDPSISALKVSYAGSANRTDLSEISKEDVRTLKNHLVEYDYISVRDNHTQELVSELGIDPVYNVPDPTILVDIPTTNVERLLTQNGIDPNAPIIGVHGQGPGDVFEPICEYYRSQGYQIVTPRAAGYADLELIGKADPFEYYSMYEYFDMVVTESLHSTIFSIKHRTPFVTIDTGEIYRSIESKTYSLLNDFGLLNRHIDGVNGDVSEFYERTAKFEQPLDETQIQKRISELRENGYEFLREVKSNEEENRVVS